MRVAMSRRQPSERLNQKLRTRAALLRAARELVAQGRTPTVTEVADAALVSKATAYRYFPTQEALLVELPLDEDAPTVESLFGDGAPADAEERAVLVQRALYDLARDHETEFRVFLRASLTRSLRDGNGGGDPLRGARRDALLAEALAPLADELPSEEVERLRTAVAMLVGIESMIVLRDVLHLEHDDAREVGEWAVRQLIRAVTLGRTAR
jgi:AcrR family transcriptional regulator